MPVTARHLVPPGPGGERGRQEGEAHVAAHGPSPAGWAAAGAARCMTRALGLEELTAFLLGFANFYAETCQGRVAASSHHTFLLKTAKPRTRGTARGEGEPAAGTGAPPGPPGAGRGGAACRHWAAGTVPRAGTGDLAPGSGAERRRRRQQRDRGTRGSARRPLGAVGVPAGPPGPAPPPAALRAADRRLRAAGEAGRAGGARGGAGPPSPAPPRLPALRTGSSEHGPNPAALAP